MKSKFMILLGAVFAIAACKKAPPKIEAAPQPVQVHEATPAPSAKPAQLPVGHPPIAATSSVPDTTTTAVSGVVKETIPAGKYIYLKLESSKGNVWAAVPKAQVNVGDQATVENAALMQKFRSKTLDREFTEIWFGTLKNQPTKTSTAPAATPKDVAKTAVVEKIPTPAGHVTIANLFATKAALAGTTVTVRGKVVKFNPAIMNRNWIHLQDGSGQSDKGNHDLTVTTNNMATVGEMVTVTGTLVLDKDFGAGYKYSVIIEGAKLSR